MSSLLASARPAMTKGHLQVARRLGALAAVLLLALAWGTPARATPLLWTFVDTQLLGLSGTVTGSYVFDVDAASNPISNINVLVDVQGGVTFAFDDTLAPSQADALSLLSSDAADLTSALYLTILLDQPMTNSGGLIALAGAVYTCVNATCESIEILDSLAGYVSGAPLDAVPEPATLALFGTGLLGLGLLRRRGPAAR